MNCSQVREYLDGLLIKDPDQSTPADVLAHIETCQACTREYENAQETFAALQLSHSIHAPNKLKEQIMSQIISANVIHPFQPGIKISIPRRFWFRGLAAAAALTAIVLFSTRLNHQPDRPNGTAVSGFVSQAWAAENAVFTQQGIIHVVNRIAIKAISDPEMAKMRWLPLVTLDPKGRIHFNQLNLPAEPGQEYTVLDEQWYESSTGRYIHVLRDEGSLVFANSFDGKAFYSAERTTERTTKIVGTDTAPDFQAPPAPAAFLGMGSAFGGGMDEKNIALFSDQGWHKLTDGTPVRVLKREFGTGSAEAPQSMQTSYVLFKIGENNAITEIEWLVDGQSWLTIRRELVESVRAPAFPWDLSGIITPPLKSQALKPQVAITKDMVLPDASVRQMLENADFQIYIFDQTPAWTSARNITDILDVASPPHRMFMIVYPAKDNRHVVLVQSFTFNKVFEGIKGQGRIIYESPNGFKVWSGSRDKWIGGILFQSAQGATRSAPSADAIGYMLESPAGTYPALGINGKITDEELRTLVDSLAPVSKQEK